MHPCQMQEHYVFEVVHEFRLKPDCADTKACQSGYTNLSQFEQKITKLLIRLHRYRGSAVHICIESCYQHEPVLNSLHTL